MKMVFRLFLLFFILSTGEVKSCSVKENIVSLSGPITMLLQELDLLTDKKLIGISQFHPITRKTSTNILKGGLFLAQKELRKYTSNVFFIDDGVELERLLKRSQVKKIYKLSTRGLSSIDAYKLSLNKLLPFLKNCESKVEEIEKRVSKIEKRLRKKWAKVIFYLGSLEHKRPEYILSHDGFIIDLKLIGNLKTYKSKLNYVLWSQKELKNYHDYIEVGLKNNQKKTGLDLVQHSTKKYDLSYPGVLTPGISQVNFLDVFTRLKQFESKL